MDPSWQPDPTGRHHYRWWDGKQWTEVVADHGVESRDPMPKSTGPRRVVVSTTPEPGTWRLTDPTPARGTPVLGATAPNGGLPRTATESTATVSAAVPTDRTEQMPVPTAGSPARKVIDPSRSDLYRPTTGPAIYAQLGEERGRPIGRIIAAIVIMLGIIGGAIYLFAFRGSDGTQQSEPGVTAGQLDGPGDFYVADVELKRGDTVRFRVEGPENRDLITAFLAPRDLADSYATQYVSDLGTTDLTDPSQLIDTYTDARDLFEDQDARDAAQGYVRIQAVDRCCAGVPDSWSFIAMAPGLYRVMVIEANGRASEVRLIIESLGRQLVTASDIDDAYYRESFFTDSGFFRSTDPYLPPA